MKPLSRIAGALALALVLAGSQIASADGYVVKDGNGVPQTLGSKNIGGVVYPENVCVVDASGAAVLCNGDGSGNIGVNIENAPTIVPSTGTGGVTAVTVGTSSAQALAAASTRRLLALDNESTTATVACNFGGTAAINTAGSFTIPPGQTRTWSGSYVPADAVNCIASAGSTPLTVEAD